MVQKLEFKHTVLPPDEPQVQKALREARVDPMRRRVYFYDTAKLALYKEKDLVLRARITDGEDDDSTVKLRPLPASGVPADWEAAKARIEVDVVGARESPSAKLDHTPDRGEIEQVDDGDLKIGKLFSKAQEALVEDALPDGTSLDDLEVLGPVDARKWKLPHATFPYDLAVEEWSLPDGSRFFELSFKVDPGEGDSARQAFAALLAELKIGPDGDEDPKTPRVLHFFADRLR